MPNIGGPELIIVLIIFVLLFGAKKLPELGSSVGRSIKNFKRGVQDEQDAAAAASTQSAPEASHEASPQSPAQSSAAPRAEAGTPSKSDAQ